MIGLNWFALSLNSKECVVRVETLPAGENPPKAIRGLDHRSVIYYAGETTKIYHLGMGAPASLQTETISIVDPEARISAHIIEISFATTASSAGFDVRLRHVGGGAFRATTGSVRDGIFQLREGFTFRAFSFMDPDRHELRWGLILNYRTGQRFIINLSDPILRQLSLNKRVIRVSDDHELDESALLAGVVDDIVRLVHSDGSATEERASDWTPQCRKDLLLEYVRLTQGPTAMAEVSRCLQHASMALTGNARINVNLAKDQLTRLQRLVLDADISHFRLISVGDGPLVRLTSEPLRVGTRR